MNKALTVLLELKESASYWSDYDVPIGIHERIEEAILELTAKPEPFKPDWVSYRQGLEDGAADKAKPIDNEELEVWYSQHTWSMDKQEYMWGFRDAEKCYQITGEI